MLQRRRLRLRDQLEGDALAAEAADAEQDAAEDGEQEIRGGLILLGLGIDFSSFSSQFMVWFRCAAMTVQTGTRLTAFSIFGLVPLHFGLITNLECQSFS